MNKEPEINRTFERSLKVIEACAQQRSGVTFGELQNICGGIAPTTLSRILQTLNATEQVIKQQQVYVLGPRYLMTAKLALGEESFEDRIQKELDRLKGNTDDSAAYFGWTGSWIAIQLKSEVDEGFHYTTLGSEKHQLHHTFYRTVQAFLNKTELKKINQAMTDELKQIKKDAYFIQLEQAKYPILRIVAPVFQKGKIQGSIGITIPAAKISTTIKQQKLKFVQEAAANLSS